MHLFDELEKKIFSSQKLLIFLVLANLIGALYGFIFYYGQQFLSTPVYLWLFIGDCPLFSLLMALSFLLILLKKEFSFLFLFSLIGSLKYGFWTVFVLIYFNSFYFVPENFFMYSVLLIAHVFLFLEAFLLVKKIRFNFSFLVFSLAFFVLNDFSDYFFGTHPPVPLNELNFLFFFTLVSSFVFSFIAFFIVKKMNA